MIGNLEEVGFFAYILPWLLTLSIVYGILEHYNLPQSKSARGVIAIVSAFLILPLGGVIQPFLTGLIKGLVVVGSGILVTIIFVELLGFKAGETENIFEKHPREFGIILIILSILVFIGAGGLELLGWRVRITGAFLSLLFFLAVMVIGTWWITSEEGE